MAKYRSRTPPTIEATKFDSRDANTHRHVNFGWPKENGDKAPHEFDGKYWIDTPHGPYPVMDGYFIVDGGKLGLHVCDPEVFDRLYVMVPEDAAHG